MFKTSQCITIFQNYKSFFTLTQRNWRIYNNSPLISTNGVLLKKILFFILFYFSQKVDYPNIYYMTKITSVVMISRILFHSTTVTETQHDFSIPWLLFITNNISNICKVSSFNEVRNHFILNLLCLKIYSPKITQKNLCIFQPFCIHCINYGKINRVIIKTEIHNWVSV